MRPRRDAKERNGCMPTDTEHYAEERPVSEGYETEHGERKRSMLAQWSLAQLVGLIVGVGVTVMGVVALARTGFDIDNIYSLHALAWWLPQSPLVVVS